MAAAGRARVGYLGPAGTFSEEALLAGAKAEGTRLRGRSGHRSDFGEWLLVSDNEERFAALQATEEVRKVTLQFLHSNGTHADIITGGNGRTRRFSPRVAIKALRRALVFDPDFIERPFDRCFGRKTSIGW